MAATTQESSAGLVFNYPPDFTVAPTTAVNANASHVNAFYVVNTIHDISYKYGFVEAAFKSVSYRFRGGPLLNPGVCSFQNNDFGKGGMSNDRVKISVQDAGDTNDADFTTPPE